MCFVLLYVVELELILPVNIREKAPYRRWGDVLATTENPRKCWETRATFWTFGMTNIAECGF